MGFIQKPRTLTPYKVVNTPMKPDFSFPINILPGTDLHATAASGFYTELLSVIKTGLSLPVDKRERK